MLVTYLNDLKYPVCMRVCVFMCVCVCVCGGWREEEWKINWLFLQVLNISTNLRHCCHIPPTFTWESKLWVGVGEKNKEKKKRKKKRQTSERRKSVIKHKYTIK